MWRYGFYKALTLTMHPGSLRARQLAPPALLLSLLAATLVRPRSGAALALAYASVAGAAGARAARSDGASAWRAAVVVPVVHLSWGAGLLAGGLTHRLRYGWRIDPVAPERTRQRTDAPRREPSLTGPGRTAPPLRPPRARPR
jgi:hypothetical protein